MVTHYKLERPTILVVDDDPIDRRLIELAFTDAGDKVRLHFCHDGKSAFDYLLQTKNNLDSAQPKACLVDINMPGLSGIDLLKLIKSEEDLRNIPVIMFSSSGRDQDINSCYEYQASGYIQKPEDQPELKLIAAALSEFWTRIIKFPASNGAGFK